MKFNKYTKYISFLFVLFFIILLFNTLTTALFEEKNVLFEISFLLIVSVIAEILVIYLKQPSVMILLVLGILLSSNTINYFFPTFPHLIDNKELIEIFSQLGAVFILYRAGLHSETDKIFNLKNFYISFLGVIVPFIFGYILGMFLGYSQIFSLFLGAGFVATSVGVTVAILKEYNVLEKPFSQIILGAAVIDDILGLLVLSLIPIFISSNFSLNNFIIIIINTLAFMIGGLKIGFWFVENILDKFRKNEFILFSLAVVFFYAFLAEFIGLSAIVGAFLAGMVMNKSKHISILDKETEVLEFIFAPVFFISLGLIIDISALQSFFIPILVITVFAVLSKVIGCGLPAMTLKIPKRESLAIGVGMVPRGEVTLIIALIGFSNNVLNSSEYTVIASMALLTTFITPPLLSWIIRGIK